jgi:hypothetical protein
MPSASSSGKSWYCNWASKHELHPLFPVKGTDDEILGSIPSFLHWARNKCYSRKGGEKCLAICLSHLSHLGMLPLNCCYYTTRGIWWRAGQDSPRAIPSLHNWSFTTINNNDWQTNSQRSICNAIFLARPCFRVYWRNFFTELSKTKPFSVQPDHPNFFMVYSRNFFSELHMTTISTRCSLMEQSS